MRTPRALRRRALAAWLACAACGALAAEAYPTHAVTMVIPFAAGGTTDIIGREVGQKLGEALHQPVVIDNRPGAGGTLAAGYVAKQPADGHVLLLATIAHAIDPAIYKNLPYDFQKDLDPIALVALTPNVLIVNPGVPARTVAELIAYIKANPGKVNYGSAGIGSTEHLSGELFASMTGAPMTHVPYKGGAPMMTDLIAGQIQLAIETSPSASPHVKSGRVRALAVTTATRSAAYPGVPTLAEAGVPGYEVTTWFALMVPHGTPAAVQQRLADDVSRVLKEPATVARFAEQGVFAGALTGAPLAEFIRAETVKWGGVAKTAHVTAE